jgi:heat shock protein HslJ
MLMSAVSLTLENDTLTLHTSQGDLVYQPASDAQLEGHVWYLNGIANKNGGILNTWIDEQITAELTDGTISGSSACNTYSASYDLDGTALTLGPIASTLMACADEEVNQREAEFLAALQNIASYEIVRSNLTLFDAEGSILITFSATLPQ